MNYITHANWNSSLVVQTSIYNCMLVSAFTFAPTPCVTHEESTKPTVNKVKHALGHDKSRMSFY